MATCKGKVTNIPLRSAIYCYAAWCKEAETAVVTIPPYTGETATTNTSAPTSTPTTGATFTVGATNTTGATNVTGATITTRVTITDIVSPVTKTNGLSPPMAPFNGVSMFTGSCTSPNIALASASAGANLTAYPWMGCSQEHHDCCAFSGDELMSLTICPHDYTTTSSACCPSSVIPLIQSLSAILIITLTYRQKMEDIHYQPWRTDPLLFFPRHGARSNSNRHRRRNVYH